MDGRVDSWQTGTLNCSFSSFVDLSLILELQSIGQNNNSCAASFEHDVLHCFFENGLIWL
jgi:hypothetical protein